MREPGIHSEIVPAAQITPGIIRAMYDIFARHYDCVSPEQFMRDLAEKDCALILRNGAGAICGFSTQKVFRVLVEGKPVRAVFSGDTIVDRAYWGEQELALCWCRFVSAVYSSDPSVPLFWFLISKGYRTYLYLPLFFETFYPNCDGPTPAFEQQVLDTMAAAKFREHYHAETGLIEFPCSQGQLKPQLADVPARRLRDPHVQFFLKRNPMYAQGHELVCLARISPSNMKRFGGRIMGRVQGGLESRESELCQGAD